MWFGNCVASSTVNRLMIWKDLKSVREIQPKPIKLTTIGTIWRRNQWNSKRRSTSWKDASNQLKVTSHITRQQPINCPLTLNLLQRNSRSPPSSAFAFRRIKCWKRCSGQRARQRKSTCARNWRRRTLHRVWAHETKTVYVLRNTHFTLSKPKICHLTCMLRLIIRM